MTPEQKADWVAVMLDLSARAEARGLDATAKLWRDRAAAMAMRDAADMVLVGDRVDKPANPYLLCWTLQ